MTCLLGFYLPGSGAGASTPRLIRQIASQIDKIFSVRAKHLDVVSDMCKLDYGLLEDADNSNAEEEALQK
jgi:hypothetical protein